MVRRFRKGSGWCALAPRQRSTSESIVIRFLLTDMVLHANQPCIQRSVDTRTAGAIFVAPPAINQPLLPMTMNVLTRISLVAALAAGTALLGACSKQDRDTAGAKTQDAYDTAKAGVKEAYADTKDAMANAWDEVKTFTFDQRDKFSANAKALQSDMEARTSKLRAEFSEAQASASRKAAMAKLKDAEADYKQKVSALGDASAATWDSAKQNTIAAWDRLQAAYHEARAD